MKNVKVLRLQYRRMSQSELSIFAEHVVKQTLDNPAFSSAQSLIAELDALRKQYAAYLADARTGNRQIRAVKDDLRERLFHQINLVADAIEKIADGAPAAIIAAGFEVRQPSNRPAGVLLPPNVATARSTGRRGEVYIALRDNAASVVRTHGIEYSVDSGQTWINSSYNTRTRFRLNGLPHHPELQLRFSAIGAGSSRSGWSEPVMVAVP